MISRILIVGLGSIGNRHLRLARKLYPEADIKVLRHQPVIDTPEFANGCFFELNKALEFAPEIAIITNPSPFHISIANVLANNGANLLIEKPISNSSFGVEQLIDSCRRNGKKILVGYNLRFLLSLQYFRNLIGQGVIGKILSVRCEVGKYLPSWRPNSNYRTSVTARRELGGGALLELSHEIDYLRWIFGEIEWVSATLSRQSNLEINVEDTAFLTLGWEPKEDGHRLIGTLNMDLIRQDSTRSCVAIGETGSLRWNGITGEVDLYEANGKLWKKVFEHYHEQDDTYISEWNDLIKCINEEKEPEVTGQDGLKVIKIIEAARRSAELCNQVEYINNNKIKQK